MNSSSKPFDLSQYVRVPYIGEAVFSPREFQYTGGPFFHGEVRREGAYWHEDDYAVAGDGEINSVSIRVGSCLLILDRPRLDTLEAPLFGSLATWAVFKAPLLALAAIVGGLVGGTIGGLFTRYIAEPRGWIDAPGARLEAALKATPDTRPLT